MTDPKVPRGFMVLHFDGKPELLNVGRVDYVGAAEDYQGEGTVPENANVLIEHTNCGGDCRFFDETMEQVAEKMVEAIDGPEVVERSKMMAAAKATFDAGEISRVEMAERESLLAVRDDLLADMTVQFSRDGNKWCCKAADHVNIQESPVGFGKTLVEAYLDYLKDKELHANPEPMARAIIDRTGKEIGYVRVPPNATVEITTAGMTLGDLETLKAIAERLPKYPPPPEPDDVPWCEACQSYHTPENTSCFRLTKALCPIPNAAGEWRVFGTAASLRVGGLLTCTHCGKLLSEHKHPERYDGQPKPNEAPVDPSIYVTGEPPEKGDVVQCITDEECLKKRYGGRALTALLTGAVVERVYPYDSLEDPPVQRMGIVLEGVAGCSFNPSMFRRLSCVADREKLNYPPAKGPTPPIRPTVQLGGDKGATAEAPPLQVVQAMGAVSGMDWQVGNVTPDAVDLNLLPEGTDPFTYHGPVGGRDKMDVPVELRASVIARFNARCREAAAAMRARIAGGERP